MPNKYLILKKKSKFAQEILPNKYETFHKGVSVAISADASAALDRYTIPNGAAPSPDTTTTSTTTTTTTITTTSTTSTTTTQAIDLMVTEANDPIVTEDNNNITT